VELLRLEAVVGEIERTDGPHFEKSISARDGVVTDLERVQPQQRPEILDSLDGVVRKYKCLQTRQLSKAVDTLAHIALETQADKLLQGREALNDVDGVVGSQSDVRLRYGFRESIFWNPEKCR
jgi:hypothetical protein